MPDPSFHTIESKPIVPEVADKRLLMRQARTQPSSISTRFTLATGVINFSSGDIQDAGGGFGTLRYYCSLYSKAIPHPGYIPQVLAMYHPSGLASTVAYPFPILEVNGPTAAIITQILCRAEIDTSTNELKVKVEGRSSSATFGAQVPGTKSVFSYHVLDGAAEGLVSKV